MTAATSRSASETVFERTSLQMCLSAAEDGWDPFATPSKKPKKTKKKIPKSDGAPPVWSSCSLTGNVILCLLDQTVQAYDQNILGLETNSLLTKSSWSASKVLNQRYSNTEVEQKDLGTTLSRPVQVPRSGSKCSSSQKDEGNGLLVTAKVWRPGLRNAIMSRCIWTALHHNGHPARPRWSYPLMTRAHLRVYCSDVF